MVEGWALFTVAAAAAAFAGFCSVALQRWDSFKTNAFDLAFFDQIIWNTAHGRVFETSFVGYNFAGQHLEPVLLLFAPAYWLGAGPPLLLTVQAGAAAAAAIPLFALVRRLGLPPAVAAAAAISYLANPYLHRAIAFDFHPEVMAPLPAFAAAWAAADGRRRVAIGLTLSLLIFKEDAVFLVFAVSAFAASVGMRREARLTASLAAAYTAAAVLVVMPLIRWGHGSDLVARYGYLFPGDSSTAWALDAVLLPFRVTRELLSPAQLTTAALFLFVSAPLALARPALLAFLAPGLALALLSGHPEQRELGLHYAAWLVPIAILAAIWVARGLHRRAGTLPVAAALVLPPLIVLAFLDPLGNSLGRPPSEAHANAVREALAQVPGDPGVSVSAQSGLLPRLSQREKAFEFPRSALKMDWVVVDRYGFRSSQSIAAGFDARLEEVRASYALRYSADGVEVFERSEP